MDVLTSVAPGVIDILVNAPEVVVIVGVVPVSITSWLESCVVITKLSVVCT